MNERLDSAKSNLKIQTKPISMKNRYMQFNQAKPKESP